jgi:hypothetical protein
MKTIIFWTVILAGCAVLVIFPGFVQGAVFFGLVGLVGYGAYKCYWNERFAKRLAESLAIGYVAGRVSRGKDIL